MNADAHGDPAAIDRSRRARTLAALGDPIRLAVVDLLRVQDLSPDALAAAVEVPGNLLSHHLKVLEEAGVVERRHSQGDRRRTYVHLVLTSLSGLLASRPVIHAPRVVFVCTQNSARSVLAEALWNSVSDVPAASAGTRPADEVNPRAREAAERHGLSVDHFPQSFDEVVRPDDFVISVCDAVNEELADRTQHLHWSILDPAAVGTDEAFDDAFSQLLQRIVQLAPTVHAPDRSS